ncbi:MAG: hypothetical protein O2886_07725 [Actinomycetota bacterium]|nr:hypothetical protein [Actinomycetota bacterium]
MSMRDAEGNELEVRPSKNAALKPFIRCYEALRADSASPEVRVRATSEHSRLRVNGGMLALSQRAESLIGQPQGSVVATMRGLGMVVQYKEVRVTSPAEHAHLKMQDLR